MLEEIFAACGANLRREVELIRLDPQYHLVFEGGGEIRATPDVARMEREIRALCPSDSLNFRKYLDDNRAKLASFRPILESPFASVRDLLRPEVLKSLKHLRPRASVDGDLCRFFRDPKVRLAFSFQSKYLGMSPFKCPSLFTILSFLEYEYGVYHPVGGCGAITAAMAHLCTKMGVKIRLNEPVETIDFSGKTVTGVQTQRAAYAADSLVINADFAGAMTPPGAQSPAPAVDRQPHCRKEILLLHFHDVPWNRRRI